jgi:PKD repeat protein
VPSSLVVTENATLTATATAVNGAPPATSYVWDCENDGTTDATTAVNTTICTYPSAGSITSKVTVTGGTASGLGTTTVTVAAAAPLFVSLAADDSTPAID